MIDEVALLKRSFDSQSQNSDSTCVDFMMVFAVTTSNTQDGEKVRLQSIFAQLPSVNF